MSLTHRPFLLLYITSIVHLALTHWTPLYVPVPLIINTALLYYIFYHHCTHRPPAAICTTTNDSPARNANDNTRTPTSSDNNPPWMSILFTIWLSLTLLVHILHCGGVISMVHVLLVLMRLSILVLFMLFEHDVKQFVVLSWLRCYRCHCLSFLFNRTVIVTVTATGIGTAWLWLSSVQQWWTVSIFAVSFYVDVSREYNLVPVDFQPLL